MNYGYPKQRTNEDGVLELEEVPFHTTPENLRRIAEFLLQSAGEIESATWVRVASPISVSRTGIGKGPARKRMSSFAIRGQDR